MPAILHMMPWELQRAAVLGLLYTWTYLSTNICKGFPRVPPGLTIFTMLSQSLGVWTHRNSIDHLRELRTRTVLSTPPWGAIIARTKTSSYIMHKEWALNKKLRFAYVLLLPGNRFGCGWRNFALHSVLPDVSATWYRFGLYRTEGRSSRLAQ